MNININLLIKESKFFIISVTILYLICFFIFLLMPKQGEVFFINKENNLDFFNYNFYQKSTSKNLIENKLDKYLIKAIYASHKNDSWIIIKNKKENKIKTLFIKDLIEGYKLKEVYPLYVIFEKNNLLYKLEVNLFKNIPTNELKFLKKEEINFYTKNIASIIKNISIKKYTNNSFKILNIKKDSIFDKLGLKNKDIIKSINNQKLTSFNILMELYKNLNKLNNIKIIIERNKKEMELNYEIN